MKIKKFSQMDSKQQVILIISVLFIGFIMIFSIGSWTGFWAIDPGDGGGDDYIPPPPPPVPPNPLEDPPDAPVLKSIIPNPNTDGEISLDWDDVSGADRYYIYRSDDGWDTISFTDYDVSESCYKDMVVIDGTYEYKIKAGSINSDCSEYSNIKAVIVLIPGVPDIPEAYAITYEITDSEVEIQVTWSEVDCNSYNLYREIDGQGTGFILIEEGLISTSYSEVLTDTGIYAYKVSAVNTLGESGLSNPTSIRMTGDGVEVTDDYMWLYLLFGGLGILIIVVVYLKYRKKIHKS